MSAYMSDEAPVARVPGFLVLFPKPKDAWAQIERMTGLVRSVSTKSEASSAEVLPARVEGGAGIHVYEAVGAVAMDLTPEDRAELEAAGATIVENTIMRYPPTMPGNEALALASGATSMADASTWGVVKVGADQSRFTGRGVRVAVLDTGIDLNHPDFAGRIVAQRSFVPGARTIQDGDGHGTHVAGTVGGREPPGKPRYSVAPDCDLIIGKVLDDQGNGYTQWIVDGLNWAALDERADIVNLSLGGTRTHDSPFSTFYEEVADRLLDAGVLIISAAGNYSRRPHHVAAMGSPAACPSVDAVVAIDQGMRIASFSCEGDSVAEPEHSAPGVDIYSAWTGGGYHTESGTSQAAPHVTGIAAQLAEATGKRGRALRQALDQLSRRRPLGPTRVYGQGLTTCP